MTQRSTTTGPRTSRPWRVLDDAQPLAAATKRRAFAASPEQIEQFTSDGVCIVPGAFTNWVTPLRDALQRNLDHPTDYAFPSDSTNEGEPGRFFNSYCNWQLLPEYSSFVFTSSAAAMAAAFLQSTTAQIFHDHAFVKEQATSKATPWHHDLPYYCVDSGLSIYVALDDTPADSAIRFLRGSHRSGETYLPRLFRDGSNYASADGELQPVPEIDESDSRILSCDLRAGDAAIFDFRTVHGAGSAPIQTTRRAFSTRWLGDQTVYVERQGVTSPPLDGLDLKPGSQMRTDWFPVLWPNADGH